VEHFGDGDGDDDDNASAWADCPSATGDNDKDGNGVAIRNTPNTIYIITLLNGGHSSCIDFFVSVIGQILRVSSNIIFGVVMTATPPLVNINWEKRWIWLTISSSVIIIIIVIFTLLLSSSTCPGTVWSIPLVES